MKRILFTICMVTILLPSFARAAEVITLTVSGSPTPNTELLITANSKTVDLHNSENSWTVNGEPVDSGKGLLKYKITTGNIGEPLDVVLNAKTPSGIFKGETVILPALLDVLWEAQTATPPFYRGKAQPSHQSVIKVFAIPLYSKDLLNEPISFDWQKGDGATLGGGIGADSTQALAEWENNYMKVTVKANYNGQKITNTLAVKSIPVSNLFYRISPLSGIQTHTVFQNEHLYNGIDLSLFAVPFGMSSSKIENNKVLYAWSVNGKSIEQGDTKKSQRITLSREKDQTKSGRISIDLKTQNTSDIMQFSTNGFTWLYNSK